MKHLKHLPKKCLYCRKLFFKPPKDTVEYWLARKYCNIQCYIKSGIRKGMHPKGEFKKGHIPSYKGKKFPQITGKNNCNWKGENVGYGALHSWIRRHKGNPKKCEYCSKLIKGKGIHWANINGLYKRNLNDWIRLCAKCHNKFDKEYNLRCNFKF